MEVNVTEHLRTHRTKQSRRLRERPRKEHRKTADIENNRAQSTTDRSRMSTALTYASESLSVIPLHGTRKGRCTCGHDDCMQPARHTRTKHGIEDATADPNRIKELWSDSNLVAFGS